MIECGFLDCADIVGKAPSIFDGEKVYVSTGALQTDHIDYEQTEIVTFENRPSRANLTADIGDVLFAKMQATKKTLVIDEKTQSHLFSTGFCAVRAKAGVLNGRCLYHIISGEDFLRNKDQNCSGATQKAITNAGLKKIRISLPPIDQQEQIADRLDAIDKAISQCRGILDTLDTTIRSRFIEYFGDPVANEKGWQTRPLEAVCYSIVDCPHSTPSYTDEDTGYMCIRTSIVKKNRILWDEIEYIPEEEYIERIKRKKPEKGDVIYTREGAILGIAAIIDRDCNVALGQRSMLLSPDTDVCLPEFLSVAMNFDSFLNKVLEGVIGSASPHINVGDIRAYNIMMPPIELQEKFARYMETIEKSKMAATACIKKAEELKAALMQEYFG